MKLRKIDSRNWVDDETGTYFEFFSDAEAGQAYEQAELRWKQMLLQASRDGVYGTKIPVPRKRRLGRPPKD
jgi:hypothetical protein